MFEPPAPSTPRAPMVTAVDRAAGNRVVNHLAKKLGHVPTDDELTAWVASMRGAANGVEEFVFVRGGDPAPTKPGKGVRGDIPALVALAKGLRGKGRIVDLGDGQVVPAVVGVPGKVLVLRDTGSLRKAFGSFGSVPSASTGPRKATVPRDRRGPKLVGFRLATVACGNPSCRQFGHGADECPTAIAPEAT